METPLDPLEVVYPTGWVHRLTGWEYHQLQYYSKQFGMGTVGQPLTGQGAHGRYSFDQLLALATAARFRDAGWGPEVVHASLQFVLDTGLEGIKAELAAGRLHLALGHPRGPQLIDIGPMPPHIEKALRFDHANLALMLSDVVAKVKALMKNPPPQGLGRRCTISPKK